MVPPRDFLYERFEQTVQETLTKELTRRAIRDAQIERRVSNIMLASRETVPGWNLRTTVTDMLNDDRTQPWEEPLTILASKAAQAALVARAPDVPRGPLSFKAKLRHKPGSKRS